MHFVCRTFCRTRKIYTLNNFDNTCPQSFVKMMPVKKSMTLEKLSGDDDKDAAQMELQLHRLNVAVQKVERGQQRVAANVHSILHSKTESSE